MRARSRTGATGRRGASRPRNGELARSRLDGVFPSSFRWWKPEAFALTHGKWSTEVWLPLALARSRWGARVGEAPNATVVLFTSRSSPRVALSWCRSRVAETSPAWARDGGASHWFSAVSSRGPCCDGGQARDPGLLRHHFLGHIGERRDGPWLFREARFADHLLRPSQYKAPVSRDTAPRVRCFDRRKDVAVPPPGFLLRRSPRGGAFDATRCLRSRGTDARACYVGHPHEAAAAKDVLVMAAEGKAGGLEYDLRRDLTAAFDPDGPARAAAGVRAPPRDPSVRVEFLMDRANYTDARRPASFRAPPRQRPRTTPASEKHRRCGAPSTAS